MLQFVIRKMLNKKWMMLALLIGNILLVSIAAANPLYSDAVLQKALNASLADSIAEDNKYPMQYDVRTTALFSDIENIRESIDVLKESGSRFGMPISEFVVHHSLLSDDSDTSLVRDDRRSNVVLSSLSGLEDHIELVEGSGMTAAPDQDGVIDAIVTEEAYYKLQLILGEVFTFYKNATPAGDPLQVRIAGVFKAKSVSDPYWTELFRSYSGMLFIKDTLMDEYFVQPGSKYSVSTNIYAQYDYSDFRVKDVDHVLATKAYYDEYFDGVVSQKPSDNFSELLTEYKKTEKKVRTTFLVLQVPIYVLLAAFIFMVSKQMLDMEQGEIAVLKSRGSSRMQIIGIYFLQSVIASLISLIIGIPLAFLLVSVLGSSNGFLEFIQRKALPIHFDLKVILYALAAAVFSTATMVIPVIKHSTVTIVNHKQTKHRSGNQPLWQKFFLDVIILGVSIYGLYNFNNQKELLSQRVLEGESLDPLLFLSASLFMLGAGLFALRILPLIVKFVFSLFKKKWNPALYTSFVRIIRTRKQQGFIMVFLVMTIAIGVFDASAARTINANDERNLRYMTGADLIVQEKWKTNGSASQSTSGPAAAAEEEKEVLYIEPDFSTYTQFDEVEKAAKVLLNQEGVVTLERGNLNNVQVMGIHTKDFGEVAEFDDSLLPEHWFNYLNAMSQKSSAVLVSSNFRDDYGYEISDAIYYRTKDGKDTIRGVIYGFVDYWPGYASTTLQKGTDGVITEKSNYLVVGNLAEMQAAWGITPYQIWIKTKGSSQFIYDYAAEKNITYDVFTDLSAELVRHKNEATLQGTNGILTVGFIAVLLMCTVGFLIYWILSIRSRELQFGIFRAMGMSMKEIYLMLINEHIWISGASILVGAGVGKLTSRLFMPLIQIAYSSIDNALPLRIVSEVSDDIRLAVIVGIMILGCLFILGWLIKEMKIAQALKLGED